MSKRKTLLLLLCILPLFSSSQNMLVHGTSIIVSNEISLNIHDIDLYLFDFRDVSPAIVSGGKISITNSLLLNCSHNPFYSSDNNDGTIEFFGYSDSGVFGDISFDLDILTVNKSSGSLHLNSSVKVKNTLYLNNGVVFCNDNSELVIGKTGKVIGGDDNSHVSGYMHKIADTYNDSFLFPLGTSGKYRPIGFFGLNGPATFSARHFELIDSGGWDNSPPIEGNEIDGKIISMISNTEYWTLYSDNPTVSASLILSWDEDYSQVENPEELLAALFTDDKWRNLGAENFDIFNNTFESAVSTNIFGTFTLALSEEANLAEDYFYHKNEISCFPNPNDGNFFLNLYNHAETDVLIEIFNLNGEIVFSENVRLLVESSNTLEVNLSKEIKSGMYFVRIIVNNKTESQQHKTHLGKIIVIR